MLIENAHILAHNPNVRNEELEAAIFQLETKIRRAEHEGEPLPFIAYRSKIIFAMALRIRTEKSAYNLR